MNRGGNPQVILWGAGQIPAARVYITPPTITFITR
jgi:hypothetical protein